MSRTWEDNRYQGGLGDLADDEDAFDDGTVDLGHGTVGGEYNVGDDGHTYSDEEVATDPDIERTGNDTVTDTSPPPVQTTGNNSSDSSNAGLLDGMDTTTLIVVAAAVAAIYLLGVRD